MQLELMNDFTKKEFTVHDGVLDFFIDPTIVFLVTKGNNKKRKTIIGVYDEALDDEFVVIDDDKDYLILNADAIQHTRKCADIFDSRLESYILHLLNSGYELQYMDLDFHARMWDFIDEFIDEVGILEDGLYKYIHHCHETGIQYKTLTSHTKWIIIIDVLYHFYNIEYRNYGVILNEHIGDQYLLLGTNFDENKNRYYAILLLDSDHEIIEQKKYTKFDNAISDFNNRFYDLKIKEHKKTEALIQSSIDEHIQFLKERKEM